jgi:NAD-dependent dihydropyrimidine dehydrogenase PreA subunit
MSIKQIDYDKCIQCHRCWEICPLDVFRLFNDEVYIAYRDDCMSCFLCTLVCPEKCIAVDGLRSRELTYPY